MRRVYLSLFAAALSASAALTPVPAGGIHVYHHENVLGTSLELKVITPNQAAADKAEAAALAEIERQAKILSSWDPTSEFSRWFATRNQPVSVSAELFEVLSLFDSYKLRTGGALDPAAEAVSRVWKQAEKQHRQPTPAELRAAVAEAQQKHWSLDPVRRTATHLTATPLAMNSFVKSYIAAKAAAAARSNVQAVVVNIGGDLVVQGDWTEPVLVADPRSGADFAPELAKVMVKGKTVATSGDYKRGYTIAGQHYSHILDPRTGQPAGRTISATIVSDNAAEAGALATACSVLSVDDCRRAARQADFLLVLADGRQVASPGWQALAAPQGTRVAYQKGAWTPGMELLISMELAKIDDVRYRRPFVAVWVEDENHYPIKTIALWFDKTRWLPDLKSWYRADRIRSMAEGSDLTSSVSSATRPAGKYTLKWDGRDNAGNPVKAGKYTVCVEASREHGGYEVLKKEIEFNGKPAQALLEGKVELGNVNLDYRKAAR